MRTLSYAIGVALCSAVSVSAATYESQIAAAVHGIDAAQISFLQGDAQSPLLIRDPQWIQRFTAFLSSVRGTEVAGTFQISTGCAVVLFRGEEAALHTWWADDRHLVLVSNDQRTELEVSKDVFVQFEALCALKRRSRHPEKEPNKSPETNALPGQ